MDRGRCIVCGGSRIAPLLRIDRVPITASHLCSSRGAALSTPTASIALGLCRDCGHVFNCEFDPGTVEYRAGYEASLRGSPRFREYDDALVSMLLERYRLRGRVIVEVGCGRGEFLRSLCQRGGNTGLGFDPSYCGDQEQENRDANVVIRQERYGVEHTELGA